MSRNPTFIPRLTNFDLPREPDQMLDLRARVRRHFAESVDAMEFCFLTEVGRRKLIPHAQKPETFGQDIQYQLRDDTGSPGWMRKLENFRGNRWHAVAKVGSDALFGGLHADTTKLDAFLFDEHPVGTNMSLALRDSTVQPGKTQRESLLHLDLSEAQLTANRRFFIYIIQSHGSLAPVFLNGYQGAGDPLHQHLVSYAYNCTQSRKHQRLDAMRADPAYQAAMATAQPRLMQPAGMTLTIMTNHTPHAGVDNLTGEPIRRQFAWQISEPPEPVVL